MYDVLFLQLHVFVDNEWMSWTIENTTDFLLIKMICNHEWILRPHEDFIAISSRAFLAEVPYCEVFLPALTCVIMLGAVSQFFLISQQELW